MLTFNANRRDKGRNQLRMKPSYFLIACGILLFIDTISAFQTHHVGSRSIAQRRISSLQMLSPSSESTYDVIVLGGGIAGSSISFLLQAQHGLTVAVVDPRVNDEGMWYPNYGEWRDEWHVLSDRMKLPELKACTTTEWEVTDCFFGGSHDMPIDERTRLPRPYVRVDRIKMQKLLKDGFSAAGGVSIPSKLSAKRIGHNLFDTGLTHDAMGSTLVLDNGERLRCKIVIDATGFESRLVGKENPYFARGNTNALKAGYQIAYGFIGHCDSLGPYDFDAMTLFDYRTSYLTDQKDADRLKDAIVRPTFMYTMPLGKLPDGKGYRVFFEETSLVGRDERRLSFEECKTRAMKRLEFHGINVFGLEEEEFCYIPMGGELPESNQRVVAFGAAANMVHPSTGYQACRMLASSTDIACIIGSTVKNPSVSPDDIAAKCYENLWNPKNRLQRDFQAFGGEFLMIQPVDQLRGFFSAFFSVEQDVWAGFLAGWPGLPGNWHHDNWPSRLKFCIDLFSKMPNSVRIGIIWYSILYTFEYGPNTLFRSLLPFIFGFGPESHKWAAPPAVVGDEAAKVEAREMIKLFKPSAVNPAKLSIQQSASKKLDIISDSNVEEQGEFIPAPFNQ